MTALLTIDACTLAPVAVLAEKLDIPRRVASSLGHRDDVVVLKVRPAFAPHTSPLIAPPNLMSNALRDRRSYMPVAGRGSLHDGPLPLGLFRFLAPLLSIFLASEEQDSPGRRTHSGFWRFHQLVEVVANTSDQRKTEQDAPPRRALTGRSCQQPLHGMNPKRRRQ